MNNPLQNLEAEQVILGACLTNREAIQQAIGMVAIDDFYREHHKKIYKVILKIFNERESVDVVTVSEELYHAKQLEECGGSNYLVSLSEVVAYSQPLAELLLTVRDCARLRRLLAP